MYIVGVDVAKRSHEATVIDANGNTIKKAFNFRNDADGFSCLNAASQIAVYIWDMLLEPVNLYVTGHTHTKQAPV